MNIEIANRLVQMRKAHGFSQEELAAQLGISRQAVSKWERAESSPDTDNLITLSRLYGVSLDTLLATEDEIPMPEPEEETKAADTKGNVHISFDKGINLVDDDGSRVHIGWDGIRVRDNDDDDEGDEPIGDFINDIEIDDAGVTYTENGERVHRDWNDTKDGKRRFVHKQQSESTGKWRTTVINEDGKRVVIDTDREPDNVDRIGSERGFSLSGFPYAVLVTGVFLLLGFLKNWWHPAWLLFLTIPIYYPVASAIRNHRLNWLDIVLPVAVTGAYIGLGIVYGLWHPLWLMLLAIPIYFGISSAVRQDALRGKGLVGIYSLVMVAAYVAIGFAFGKTGWAVGWLLFLTVPMFSSIVSSIRRSVGIRWLKRFPWELLIVAGYLFVGLMFGIWHPTWVAFVLIPVLRWAIDAVCGKKAGSEADDDDDDDEEDFIDGDDD